MVSLDVGTKSIAAMLVVVEIHLVENHTRAVVGGNAIPCGKVIEFGGGT